MKIAFGDTAKVVSSKETDALGISGKIGSIFGETVPSLSQVEVIRELKEDAALNIFIEELDSQFWLPEYLLEFVDHGEGVEVSLGDVRAVRRANGSWKELTDKSNSVWWKFWSLFK